MKLATIAALLCLSHCPLMPCDSGIKLPSMSATCDNDGRCITGSPAVAITLIS
jgi:hypothetical protein